MDLKVELVNEPAYTEEGTQLYGGGALKCDTVSSEEDKKKEEEDTEEAPLVAGNITFLTFTNLSFEAVEEIEFYYKYIIWGPSFGKTAMCIRRSNWTGEYLEMGNYHYAIHAIAVLNPDLAFHARVTGRFEIFGECTTFSMSWPMVTLLPLSSLSFPSLPPSLPPPSSLSPLLPPPSLPQRV